MFYVFLYITCTYKVNVLCIKFSDILAYFYTLDTFIEIRCPVPPFAVVSSVEALLFSGSAAPVGGGIMNYLPKYMGSIYSANTIAYHKKE